MGASDVVGSVPLLLLGRVAEWQTRWLQVPVFARTWGFKSPLAHHGADVGGSGSPGVYSLLSALHPDMRGKVEVVDWVDHSIIRS